MTMRASPRDVDRRAEPRGNAALDAGGSRAVARDVEPRPGRKKGRCSGPDFRGTADDGQPPQRQAYDRRGLDRRSLNDLALNDPVRRKVRCCMRPRRVLPLAVFLSALAMPRAGVGAPESVELERDFAAPSVRFWPPTAWLPRQGKNQGPAGPRPSTRQSLRSSRATASGRPCWRCSRAARCRPRRPPSASPTSSCAARWSHWIQRLRRHEAEHNAGDPGPVLARRLSNAEYDYTIRDLLGVDLRPTREFPVDPANEAGFDNSGESLAMSPALLKKYLQAARTVAEHLVLQPDGFASPRSPWSAETDRDKYGVAADHGLLQAAAHRSGRLFRGGLALRAPRGPGPAAGHPGRDRRRGKGEPQVPGHGLDGAERRPGGGRARWPSCRRCSGALPAPSEPADARQPALPPGPACAAACAIASCSCARKLDAASGPTCSSRRSAPGRSPSSCGRTSSSPPTGPATIPMRSTWPAIRRRRQAEARRADRELF